MKSKELIVIMLGIALASGITGCSSGVRAEVSPNCDPFPLALQNEYVREGNPWTGQGYSAYSGGDGSLPASVIAAPYQTDSTNADTEAIPLVKAPIVKRIHIYKQQIGDVYVESVNAYVMITHGQFQN